MTREKDVAPTAKRCKRCGTCCRKGGPALHHADLLLFHDAILGQEDLYTLRIGEPVHDQIKGRVVLLDAECVKIRSGGHGSGCRFYQAEPGTCLIHAAKPEECAALACWDTAALAAVSARPRLSRLDILGRNTSLAELIREHDLQCGVVMLREHLRKAGPDSAKRIRQAQAYDHALRALLQEKAGIPFEQLSFLLGRPLPEVVRGIRRWLDIQPPAESHGQVGLPPSCPALPVRRDKPEGTGL